MYKEQESIYNLIPKHYVPPSKPKQYKSRHCPLKAPTGSTFINKTTSRIVNHPFPPLIFKRFQIWEAISKQFSVHTTTEEDTQLLAERREATDQNTPNIGKSILDQWEVLEQSIRLLDQMHFRLRRSLKSTGALRFLVGMRNQFRVLNRTRIS